MSERKKPPRVSWLLHCYPRAWRERYGDEMQAVLEQHRITPATWLSLVFGAIDARLHREMLTGKVQPMIERLRTSAITIFLAFFWFGLAYAFLQRVTDPRAPFDAVVSQHPEIGVAFTIIVIASEIAFLAVVLGGLPIAYGVIRSAMQKKQNIFRLFGVRPRFLLALLGGCVITAIGYVVFTALTQHIGNLHPPIWAPLYFALVVLFLGILLFVLTLPTTFISAAVARSTLGRGVLRFTLIPASIATAAMVVAFITTLYWGIRIWIDAPQFFNSGDGLSGGSPFYIVVGMMLLATGVASWALWRGITARETGEIMAADIKV